MARFSDGIERVQISVSVSKECYDKFSEYLDVRLDGTWNFENETEVKRAMIARIVGYDYDSELASIREAMAADKAEREAIKLNEAAVKEANKAKYDAIMTLIASGDLSADEILKLAQSKAAKVKAA